MMYGKRIFNFDLISAVSILLSLIHPIKCARSKILVTGVTGAIGKATVEHLL